MKLATLAACAWVAANLCGCMSTRHVEQSSVTSTGIDPNGCLSACYQATHDERQWHGPWFVQPDRAQP